MDSLSDHSFHVTNSGAIPQPTPRYSPSFEAVILAKVAEESELSPLGTRHPPFAAGLGEAARNIRSEMRRLLEEPLLEGNAEDWRSTFFRNFQAYEEYSRTHARLMRGGGGDIGDVTSEDLQRATATVRELLSAHFAEAAGELDFVTSVVESAAKEAMAFANCTVSEDHRDEDLANVGRFSFYASVFGMCLNTLMLIVQRRLTTPRTIVEAVFEMARHAALEFDHATRVGKKLREGPSQVVREPVDRIGPDDDDLGHVEQMILAGERRGGARA
jgi:hypothetical protein